MPFTDRRTKRLHRVIKTVIDRWNPYSLLGGDQSAPPDEFEAEIAELRRYSRWFWTPDDATEAISRVFGRAFSDQMFRPDQCRSVGAALFAALDSAGLLPSSDPPPAGSWRVHIDSATLLAGSRAVVFITTPESLDFGVGLRSHLDECPLEPGFEQPRAIDPAGKERSLFALALADPSHLNHFRPGQEAALVTPQ